MISDEIEPPIHIRLACSHKVSKNHTFRVPMRVIPLETEMLEGRVRQRLFEPT
jgi:hypothetical protein